MLNDVQHMPYQILDLGLKCYLRTSDFALYFVYKNLMRMVNENFNFEFP